MSKSALEELYSIQFLDSVWKRMLHSTPKKKRNSTGVDDTSINILEKSSDAFIRELSLSIKNKTYSPSPLSARFIPKANGKERVICIPTVKDRLLQRALLQLLHNKGLGFANSVNFGFVKGQSVKSAAQKAIELRNKYGWCYKADISSFFDSIDRDILKKSAAKKIRSRSLLELISQSIDIEIENTNKKNEEKLVSKGIIRGRGLRQGMPISPYLSNIFLKDFDDRVIKSKIPMIRYADDLIAFGSSEDECKKFHEFCKLELGRVGLEIHDITDGSKTQIVDPNSEVEFLGLGLAPLKGKRGYMLIVTKNQKDKIKQNMLEYSNIEFCIKKQISIKDLLNRLDQVIDGYKSAYAVCSDSQSLIDFLSSTKNIALQKILLDNYKIDSRTLTNKQKWFLTIDNYNLEWRK